MGGSSTLPTFQGDCGGVGGSTKGKQLRVRGELPPALSRTLPGRELPLRCSASTPASRRCPLLSAGSGGSDQGLGPPPSPPLRARRERRRPLGRRRSSGTRLRHHRRRVVHGPRGRVGHHQGEPGLPRAKQRGRVGGQVAPPRVEDGRGGQGGCEGPRVLLLGGFTGLVPLPRREDAALTPAKAVP